jgi:O-antigen ligase
MARAVTALIVVGLYAVFMAGLHVARRLESRAALALGMTFFLVALTCSYAGIPFVADALAGLGRDVTLTGRTEIWSALMPSIYQQPLLGYGFYAFWLGLTGESGNVIRTVHWFFGYAHNGMLEIVLQLGIVGLGLFLVTFVHAMKDAVNAYRARSSGVDWYIGLIILTVLYNIDEATVVWPTDLLSILYVIACCGLSIAAKRLNAGSKERETRSMFAYKAA